MLLIFLSLYLLYVLSLIYSYLFFLNQICSLKLSYGLNKCIVLDRKGNRDILLWPKNVDIFHIYIIRKIIFMNIFETSLKTQDRGEEDCSQAKRM